MAIVCLYVTLKFNGEIIWRGHNNGQRYKDSITTKIHVHIKQLINQNQKINLRNYQAADNCNSFQVMLRTQTQTHTHVMLTHTHAHTHTPLPNASYRPIHVFIITL